jgi:hypothetical protein
VSATPDAQQGGSGLPANGVPTVAGEEPKTTVLGRDGAAKGDQTAVLPKTTGPGDTPEAARDEDARDLPAGVDPGQLASGPSSARRGRLRRRLRYLRAVREILLRDIGGFYYEAQRSESGLDPHRRLLDAKAARLARLDEEIRELETRLDEAHPQTIVRQPGIGGTCPQCGELHASDARYCSRCGAALGGRASRARLAAPIGPAPATATASGEHEEAKATTASLWGRPKRPEPPASAAPGEATQAEPAKSEPANEPVDAEPAKADRPAAPSRPPAAARKPAPPPPGADEPAPTGSERA